MTTYHAALNGEWQELPAVELAGCIAPEVLQFEGEPSFAHNGVPYSEIVATAGTRDGAIQDFRDQLAALATGAVQIAWRRRPQIICFKGRWRINARLLAMPAPALLASASN
jgi:hypothetical protein